AVAVGCVAVVTVDGTVLGCVVVTTGAGATGIAMGCGVSRAGTVSAFGYVPTRDTLRSREANAFATSASRMPATRSMVVWKKMFRFISIGETQHGRAAFRKA